MSRALFLADVLVDAFRGRSGFVVDVVRGWEDRGKPQLYPRGVMNHHTGPGSYNALLNYMGHTSKIAPLCNVATSRPMDGKVRITLVASGKSNHAGVGNYSWIPKNKANYYTIGFENQNDGKESWPDQQNEAIAIANKAILDHLKLGADRLLDHKTWAPTRKVDRVHIDLGSWRDYVKNINVKGIPVKELAQAVVVPQADRNYPDREMGRVLAQGYALALVVSDGSKFYSLTHGGEECKVTDYAIVVGGHTTAPNAPYDRLSGGTREETASEVFDFISTHKKSEMNRRGRAW